MPLGKNALIGIIAGGTVAAAAVVVVVVVVFSGPHEQFEYTPVIDGNKGDPVSIDVANKVIYGSFDDADLGQLEYWFYEGEMISRLDGDDTCYRLPEDDETELMELWIEYALPTDDAVKKDSKKVGDVECDIYQDVVDIEIEGTEMEVFISWCVADGFVHEEISYPTDFPDETEVTVYVDHESLSQNDDRFDPEAMCEKIEDLDESGTTMFSTGIQGIKKKMAGKFAKFVKAA
ncbi:hypothetical protein P9112_000658 [Eukaryota sp. TZLM1-RC]